MGTIFHALLATSVVVAAAVGASYAVIRWVPPGSARNAAERWLIAPGEALYARAQEHDVQASIREGRQRLARAGIEIRKLQNTPLGRQANQAATKAEAGTRRLLHLYNAGAWAATGFAVCLLLTLIFGVSSIKSALSLGFKVTLFLIVLQATLILGGFLALHKHAG